MMDLLIDVKNARSASGAPQRPKAIFSCLSRNPSCFDSKAKPPRAVDERGDVIRWSIFDLSRRAASNSFLSFDLLFLRFLSQDRGYPDNYFRTFSALLAFLKRRFLANLTEHSFVDCIFMFCKEVIYRTVFDFNTGNPIFLVLRLSFALFVLFVIYRVIKRAINKV